MTVSPVTGGGSVLITGAAGFIGFHLAQRLLALGDEVIGLDNLNSYYDVALKHERLRLLKTHTRFSFVQCDITDREGVQRIFEAHRPATVVNLAAQAGVRYSLENPAAYIQSNIVGFANILETCRKLEVEHLLYASSSSVYGGNTKVPFEETDPVDHPVSLYAATKRSNELMADTYAHLYGLPSTGLRFFTVYGPYGRPDMAYFAFATRYFAGKAIHVFNDGDAENDLSRDFTYVDDVIESIVRLMPILPRGPRPHEIFNIGGSTPAKLSVFVSTLEDALSASLGREVEFKKVYEGMKPGDVRATYANANRLESLIGYKPQTTLRVGLQAFTNWYVHYREVHGAESDPNEVTSG